MPPSLRLRDAVAQLQRAVDCWARNGTWVFEPEQYFYNSIRGDHSNRTCALRPNQHDRINEIAHRWVPPPACPGGAYLRGASLAKALRQHLPCHRTLVVGDSLNLQLTDTLDDYALYAEPTTTPLLRYKMVFNSHLSLSTEPSFVERTADGGNRTMDAHPWIHLLKTFSPTTVLLNRGLHYLPDGVVLPEYNATLAYIRSQLPRALLLVRTSPPGHFDCYQAMNTPPLLRPQVTTRTKRLPYGWDELIPQNAKVDALVRRSYADLAAVLDVVPATLLRADGHRVAFRNREHELNITAFPYRVDCLHYCVPGPIDMWAELVGNALLLAQRLGILRPCVKRLASPVISQTPAASP